MKQPGTSRAALMLSSEEKGARVGQWPQIDAFEFDGNGDANQTAGGQTPQRPRIHWASGVNPHLFRGRSLRHNDPRLGKWG